MSNNFLRSIIQFGVTIGEVNLCNIPIKIYSNYGYEITPYPETNKVMNTDLGLKWQCVEFVRRFYFYKHGNDLKAKWQEGDACDWPDACEAMNLIKLPVEDAIPGDIACFDGGLYGHVCIVGLNSSNTDSIHLISQNAFNDIRDLGYNITYENPILDTGLNMFRLNCILRDKEYHKMILKELG
jgi:hypothetical protein